MLFALIFVIILALICLILVWISAVIREYESNELIKLKKEETVDEEQKNKCKQITGEICDHIESVVEKNFPNKQHYMYMYCIAVEDFDRLLIASNGDQSDIVSLLELAHKSILNRKPDFSMVKTK